MLPGKGRIPIGWIIGGGYLALLLLLAAVGGVMLLQVVAVREHTGTAVARNEMAMRVSELMNDHNDVHNRLWQYVQDPSKARFHEETDPRNCLLGRWYYGDGAAQLFALEPALLDRLRQFEEPHARYHQALGRVAETHDPEETLSLWTLHARPAMVQLRLVMYDVQRALSEAARIENRDVYQRTRVVVTICSVLLAVALLCGLILAWTIPRAIGRSLRQVATGIADAGGGVLAALGKQAAGTERQVQAVAESRTAVEALQAASDQAVQALDSIAHRALETESIGMEGRKVVGRTVTLADGSLRRMEGAVATVHTLAERALAVGEIVALVDDLADRSNVLGLNAALEAVRGAGKGSGFAVLAAEIRSLSRQSSEATSQIDRILAEIRGAVADTAVATEGTRGSLSATLEALGLADTAISRLGKVLGEAAGEVALAKESANRQQEHVARFHEAMRAIGEAAAESHAAARQLDGAVRDLEGIGRTLIAMIRGPWSRA
jgi:methyl-accepting chemotaxis protein